jgi:hypothetical protein
VLLNTSPSYTYFNAAGRAVEFDTVPIGAVDHMTVTKTGMPDREAEGIGGSIELSPRTAIGAKRLFAHITLGGGLETDRHTGLYRDEVVIGGPLAALIRDDVVLREINRWRQRAFEQAECLRCVYFIAWDREACGCDGGARTFSGTAALAMSGRA